MNRTRSALRSSQTTLRSSQSALRHTVGWVLTAARIASLPIAFVLFLLALIAGEALAHLSGRRS